MCIPVYVYIAIIFTIKLYIYWALYRSCMITEENTQLLEYMEWYLFIMKNYFLSHIPFTPLQVHVHETMKPHSDVYIIQVGIKLLQNSWNSVRLCIISLNHTIFIYLTGIWYIQIHYEVSCWLYWQYSPLQTHELINHRQ